MFVELSDLRHMATTRRSEQALDGQKTEAGQALSGRQDLPQPQNFGLGLQEKKMKKVFVFLVFVFVASFSFARGWDGDTEEEVEILDASWYTNRGWDDDREVFCGRDNIHENDPLAHSFGLTPEAFWTWHFTTHEAVTAEQRTDAVVAYMNDLSTVIANARFTVESFDRFFHPIAFTEHLNAGTRYWWRRVSSTKYPGMRDEGFDGVPRFYVWTRFASATADDDYWKSSPEVFTIWDFERRQVSSTDPSLIHYTRQTDTHIFPGHGRAFDSLISLRQRKNRIRLTVNERPGRQFIYVFDMRFGFVFRWHVHGIPYSELKSSHVIPLDQAHLGRLELRHDCDNWVSFYRGPSQ